MKKTINLIFLILFTFSIYANEINSFKNIEKDERGYFLTVLNGEEIEKVNLKVIGKIMDERSLEELLLIKAIDNLGIRSKDIAEGMSGSPVYINNNLIGAVSYKLGEDRTDIAIVKPLILIAPHEIESFDKFYYGDITIKPGSSISITPCIGDFTLDNLGTITLIKGNRFFALGHPLNNKGDISYFLTKSTIDYLFEGDKTFKIGRSKDPIGIVDYDGYKGIEGIFTDEIEGTELNMKINRGDNHYDYSLLVNKDTKTLNIYLESILKKGILNSVDSLGYYVGKYEFNIYNEDDVLIYTNGDYIFYEDGIVNSLSGVISEDILQIVNNPYKKFEINRIDLNISLENEKKVIYLRDILISKQVYTIGETLNVNLFYLIHQDGFNERKIPIEIPLDFKIGSSTISVNRGKNKLVKIEEFETFTRFLRYNEQRIKNNQIKIEIRNKSENKVIEKIVEFDRFVTNDKEVKKEIVIDSYKASDKE